MLYDEKVIEEIRNQLIKQKLTIAVAESVTAGHLQAALSSALEASKFFQGGITAYNAGQKCRHLNIEPIAALDNDCVTEQVAGEMATQVTKLFISDFGIAITGYAAPMPEKNIKDVFAFFSIAKNGKVLLTKKIKTGQTNIEAQIDYTNQVLKHFTTVLKNKKAGK